VNDNLRAALVDAAQDLPTTVIVLMAEAVKAEGEWSVRARNRLLDAHPAATSRRHTMAICEAWKDEPTVTGATIAGSLQVAQRTANQIRSSQNLEVAWTSPNPGENNARTTRQALIETIRSAVSTLYCLSFAAYKDQGILDELTAAATRGVKVHLVLETKEGGLTHDAQQAFSALGNKVHFYTWPVDKRPIIGNNPARFHAKALVADGATAFVTSANLTGAAMDHNIELGIVITGGRAPRDIQAQIERLIETGILVPVAA
jgi:cardiolipin synthase